MANRLTINLLGVCVHIKPDSLPDLDKHRVVYPSGSMPVDGFELSPHSPVMTIVTQTPIPETRTFQIDNTVVFFSSTNVVSGPFSGTMCCAPHLSFFFPGRQLDVGKVRDHEDFQGAFIDFTHGEMHGTQIPPGSVSSQVFIDYDSSTTSLTIAPTGTTFVETVQINLPATITIDQAAESHRILDYFLTLQVFAPTDPPVQDSLLFGQFGFVINFMNVCLGGEGDVGCSNSQFP